MISRTNDFAQNALNAAIGIDSLEGDFLPLKKGQQKPFGNRVIAIGLLSQKKLRLTRRIPQHDRIRDHLGRGLIVVNYRIPLFKLNLQFVPHDCKVLIINC